jgi:hypothetical protein
MLAVFFLYKNDLIFNISKSYGDGKYSLGDFGNDIVSQYQELSGKRVDTYTHFKSSSGFEKLCNSYALMISKVLDLKKPNVVKNLRFHVVYADESRDLIHNQRRNNKNILNPTVTVNGITTPSDQNLESGTVAIKDRLKAYLNSKLKDITSLQDLPRTIEELNKENNKIKVGGSVYTFDKLVGSFSSLFNKKNMVGVIYRLDKPNPAYGKIDYAINTPRTLFFSFKLANNSIEADNVYISSDSFYGVDINPERYMLVYLDQYLDLMNDLVEKKKNDPDFNFNTEYDNRFRELSIQTLN